MPPRRRAPRPPGPPAARRPPRAPGPMPPWRRPCGRPVPSGPERSTGRPPSGGSKTPTAMPWRSAKGRADRSYDRALGVAGWVVIAVVVLLVLWTIYAFNRLVKYRNRTDEGWAQIDV